MVGRKMLHQDECHAGIDCCRHGGKEGVERSQPTCRRTNPYDRESWEAVPGLRLYGCSNDLF